MKWYDEEVMIGDSSIKMMVSGLIDNGRVTISLGDGVKTVVVFEKQYSSMKNEDPDVDVIRNYFAAKISKILKILNNGKPEEILKKYGLGS